MMMNESNDSDPGEDLVIFGYAASQKKVQSREQEDYVRKPQWMSAFVAICHIMKNAVGSFLPS
jgi:hypothetical protein